VHARGGSGGPAAVAAGVTAGRAALAALFAAVLVLPGPVRAAPKHATLEVFAAASLTEAFTELGKTLQARRPGLTVRINLAGSQQLAAQIEQGARADVFASADRRWMSEVAGRGLLAGGPRTFAVNRLVVVLPAGNPGGIRSLQDLAKPGLKLVVGAPAVPVGQYAREVIANLARDPSRGEDFERRVLGNVVSEEENVKSVLAKVRLGEADAGIVYRTDVTPAVAADVRVLELPDSANVAAPYPIAIVKGSRSPEAARAFVDLVLSPEGRRVLGQFGFSAPRGATP